MKEAFEIARIIQKSLKGKLSESEERQLSGWRKVSDENERAFQRMISEDFYTIGMEKLEMYDSRVAYGRFLQKKYQQRRKRRFLINMARVAAVALPFVIALVLYVGLNRRTNGASFSSFKYPSGDEQSRVDIGKRANDSFRQRGYG